MKSIKIKLGIAITYCLLGCASINAQQYADPEYVKVTENRAAKIVDNMELSASVDKQAVVSAIAKQYQNLSKIQEEKEVQIEAVKNSDLSKEKKDKKIEKIKNVAVKKTDSLHKTYIKELEKYLDEKGVSDVKDGMTYGVMPKTYVAFQDMLPNLTQEQKDTIYSYLKEAREHAMDGGSSKEKHAWFGKYKGKINNYLSAQGYDLNKESEEWHKRLEARKKENKE
ncbi:DUF3826 domain-containing protein [Neptunitalea lumnitzerae]|uniref:DUF3826 domain-containing protein n=1 Tax=Neptunitalea lumnitzerae TaxID=2965509 RepID=A0ABQ5MJM6_9FLAO|nr:DUF3826 domain-containing protein [Neptunitalea sp. Y10]GLB49618.1 hypothetical protein Y10_19860 [Neptunitalea sp. Y10]